MSDEWWLFFIQESGESHRTVDSDGQHTLLPQSDGEKQHGSHVFPGAAQRTRHSLSSRYIEAFPRGKGHLIGREPMQQFFHNIYHVKPNTNSDFWGLRHLLGSSNHEMDYWWQHCLSKCSLEHCFRSEPCRVLSASPEPWSRKTSGWQGIEEVLLALQQHHALDRYLLLSCCKATTCPHGGDGIWFSIIWRTHKSDLAFISDYSLQLWGVSFSWKTKG